MRAARPIPVNTPAAMRGTRDLPATTGVPRRGVIEDGRDSRDVELFRRSRGFEEDGEIGRQGEQ
jgi:hypothetical protein